MKGEMVEACCVVVNVRNAVSGGQRNEEEVVEE